MLDLTNACVSRFILGQRGQGKSATILHLFEDMKDLGLLPILIDRYDNYPLLSNKNYFLYSMIQMLTFKIAYKLMIDPKCSKKLNTTQKEQLSLFIEVFYDPESADECINCAKNIRKKKICNRIKLFINKHLGLLNNLIGAGVKVGIDLIKSYAGVDVNFNSVRNNYLQEIELNPLGKYSMSDIINWGTSKLIKILKNLCDIAISIGYKSVVIMFDKLDEVSEINGDINKVTQFVQEFLTDTELLYTDKLSIVVSLWSEVKNALNKVGVRFDKFKEVDIRWRNDELECLINKRLSYFSIDKNVCVSFESLIPNKLDRDKILELSDHSPRSLINLLGYISAEERGNNISSFSSDALTKGYMMYCKKFDYVSAQPSRTGKGNDLSTWIIRLLRLKLVQFSKTQYADFYNLKKNTTGSKHIETFIKFNLIRDSMSPTDDDEIVYEIVDPRIRFLIARGEQTLDL